MRGGKKRSPRISKESLAREQKRLCGRNRKQFRTRALKTRATDWSVSSSKTAPMNLIASATERKQILILVRVQIKTSLFKCFPTVSGSCDSSDSNLTETDRSLILLFNLSTDSGPVPLLILQSSEHVTKLVPLCATVHAQPSRASVHFLHHEVVGAAAEAKRSQLSRRRYFDTKCPKMSPQKPSMKVSGATAASGPRPDPRTRSVSRSPG